MFPNTNRETFFFPRDDQQLLRAATGVLPVLRGQTVIETGGWTTRIVHYFVREQDTTWLSANQTRFFLAKTDGWLAFPSHW